MWNDLSDLISRYSHIWHLKLVTVGEVDLGFGNVIVAMVLMFFATRLSRFISNLINRRVIDPFVHDSSSKATYQTFAFYASFALVIVVSLSVAGIPLTVFTVVGGALAIGVGFGSQNIVNNFISGTIILFEKPIKVGDIVEIDGTTGTILGIGTRSTKMRSADGKIFIVPNSFFLEKAVLNWSYGSTNLRTEVVVGVAYGTDARLVENICLDILLNTEGINQDPKPTILFDDFGDSTLNFKLIFWCDITQVPSLPFMRSKIRYKIDEKFKANNIEIAFPQRDMNLKLNRALEVKLLS